MVVTIEGYNKKKNKSVRTASELAAFSAIANGDKTLVINLINPDIDTAERMLIGVGMEESINSEYDTNVSDDGIDALLRQAETRMLTKEDFDNYIKNMIYLENRLDVATVTKNRQFNALLLSPNRFEALRRVILSAKRVYDNIFIILDSKETKVNDMIKKLDEIDVCLYCIKQGFKEKAPATGKQIIYVVTEYNSKSRFTFDSIKKEFVTANPLVRSNEEIAKIDANIYALDAAISGNIVNFVAKNKIANKEDINYEWISDELKLLSMILKKEKVSKQKEMPEKIESKKRTFKLFDKKNINNELKQDVTKTSENEDKSEGFVEARISESVEEVAQVQEEKKKYAVKIKGVGYSSLRAACEAYDKDYDTVKEMLKAGYPIKEAFGLE